MAQHNVAKAKAIHQVRQAQRDANVAAMKRGTVATQLQGFINHAYKRPNAKPRGLHPSRPVVGDFREAYNLAPRPGGGRRQALPTIEARFAYPPAPADGKILFNRL